ncbi:NAD(+) synthase [Mycoplasma todarodis]|uniref:NH(3)-dependent NAD(+) synthetase n=1 Tax=Mycoplasma todarodis TaxID=1937191 RepID=A0A4R0XKK7_9MOLU|nr:NAD(+) synthase [Mycoplasma todarodis]TCG10994.1 NAD(+) synthase [Mycoplasma todarodis]
MKYSDYLVQWLQEEVKKANMDGVIVGLSGGVDSSVVAALAKKAFPNNSLGVYLPINNMGQDLIDANEVAKAISIETKLIDLTKSYEAMKHAVGTTTRLATANIKPRLRMSALYAIAQEKRYLVLGTDNAAEWILGYFTKYGDGGVDLLPIVHLTKGEVKEMAKELKLPEVVWTKKPTAALWEGQTDEEELGFSYDEVDKYLKGKEVEENVLTKIKKQIAITNHKRVPLPEPKSQDDYK